MASHVAFLRGMNLGGRRLSNAELVAAFEGTGIEGAKAFRASGNVVFDAPGGDGPHDLLARIEGGLEAALGYEVPVFLRSAEEVAAIAVFEPFEAPLRDASGGRLQVALLPAEPGRTAAADALDMATDEDRLALRGTELYWLPSGGTRDSALDLRGLEAALGPWTMRTKATIEELAARHLGVA